MGKGISLALDLGHQPDPGAQRAWRDRREHFSKGLFHRQRVFQAVPAHVYGNQPKGETLGYSPPFHTFFKWLRVGLMETGEEMSAGEDRGWKNPGWDLLMEGC